MDMENGIRNHFSKVFVDTFKMIWAILLVIVLNVLGQFKSKDIDDALTSTPGYAKYIAVAVVVVFVVGAFLLNFLHWRKTYIVIDDENLIVNNNYFWQKKVKTVRLSSIATVNFQQGIPERIFGTYRLQVDINSSVTADSTDFNLVFDKETAEQVKAMLTGKVKATNHVKTAENTSNSISDKPNDLSWKNAEAVENIQLSQEEKPELIYQFTYGQVIRHCFLGFSFMVLLITIGTAAGTIAGTIAEDGFNTSMILPALIVIVPLLWSQIAPFFNLYGFKIEKLGNSAIVSYGLFTHRQYNLPLNKTNAIIIHQPLFARLFGYYYGELINVGMGDEDNNGTPIFCLCVKEEEMREIIRQIKPDLQIGGLGEKSPKEAYYPTAFWYGIFGVAAIIVITLIKAKFWWIGAIFLVLMLLCAALSYKTKALAVLDDKAIITTGVFHKRTIVVPNKKIQNIYRKSGPLSRKLGLVNGQVTLLGALAYRDHDIGYFKKERFDALFNNIVEVDD